MWLLKNVLWWYLLPPLVAMRLFFAHLAACLADSVDQSTLHFWVAFLFPWVCCVLICASVYWLNQRAVCHHLNPRRDELLAIRDELLKSES